MKHRILVIDDSQFDLDAITLLLEGHGFHVRATTSPSDGIAYVRQHPGTLTLAIIDYNMPEQNGAEVAGELSRLDPSLQIATYSGDTSTNAFGDTLSSGSQYFIRKGTEPEHLVAIIRMFAARFEERQKPLNLEPMSTEDLAKIARMGLVGCSRHLLAVADLIQKYAPESETVLITGENGTGKEKVARALHNLSGRRGLFIPINCAAIPAELLESELFGHEKGAFSGALKDKVGIVMAANNGTVFLDEIGDMPMLLQVKLLRFLQEREVRVVGSNRIERVNTRVIVATNAHLEKSIALGKFRQDLYYRIKGLPIELLPLRERPEDIKPLVHRFSQNASQEKGSDRLFLEQTVKVMMRYKWPGNVRELENEVRRAILLAPETKIRPEDLDTRILQAVAEADRGSLDFDGDYQVFREKQRLRNEDEERRFLTDKSRRAGSVRELARDILRISNSTLQNRLKVLGINLKSEKDKQTEGKEYEAI